MLRFLQLKTPKKHFFIARKNTVKIFSVLIGALLLCAMTDLPDSIQAQYQEDILFRSLSGKNSEVANLNGFWMLKSKDYQYSTSWELANGKNAPLGEISLNFDLDASQWMNITDKNDSISLFMTTFGKQQRLELQKTKVDNDYYYKGHGYNIKYVDNNHLSGTYESHYTDSNNKQVFATYTFTIAKLKNTHQQLGTLDISGRSSQHINYLFSGRGNYSIDFLDYKTKEKSTIYQDTNASTTVLGHSLKAFFLSMSNVKQKNNLSIYKKGTLDISMNVQGKLSYTEHTSSGEDLVYNTVNSGYTVSSTPQDKYRLSLSIDALDDYSFSPYHIEVNALLL